ncbi:hypothetical protein G4G28_08855 [Massilia sp. Dwa41.01b]|uniref:hypothetical protein n=1 Tax=unclassified Massilia TaxID=2609279 RepID=UPI001600EB68|nr:MULTISPECIES: hypothetical protein [unclassified Massilia]QNA88574.1 hypothetical protein G4G28_08855 [Massilia sp. Dwa41.01b]QNA99470.1 hypothetical protein G4G31_12515 [Massilia sp. Se16.2.3]
MTSFRPALASSLLGISLLLGGCGTANGPVSLQEVREFADASAKLGGYAELSRRYRDTYEREQPYLPATVDKLARENDAKRRAVYEDFVSVQKAVVLYMQTLSLLAGDDRYDLTPRIDDLGNGLKANAESGLQQRHIAAYTGLTRLLTRVIASGYQNRSVETMVRDGDADVQTLLEAMISLTRLYYKTNENEKKTVLGIFDVELPFTNRNTDRMLVTLAKVHYLNKSSEYKLIDRRYDLALQGLTKVALGHQKLRENMHKLSQDEVRRMLGNYGRDLRMIREGLAGD